MNSGSKFIIFSMGRCGGSNLQFALSSLIKEGEILGEFLSSDDIEAKITKKSAYRKKRDKLFSLLEEKHNGEYIGHKCNRGNVEYFADDYWRIVKELIEYYDRVIFCLRDNLLKHKISYLISRETNVWNVSKEEDKDIILESEKTININIDSFRKTLRKDRRTINKFKKVLEKENTPNLTVFYEGLYGVKDIETRIDEVERIVKWLNFEVNVSNISFAKEFMSPDKKLNGKETYSKVIDNLSEVNLKLGSEFGYLF